MRGLSGLRVLGRGKSSFRPWDVECLASGVDFYNRWAWDVSVRGFRAPNVEEFRVGGRYKATWKSKFRLPWRKAGPLKSAR